MHSSRHCGPSYAPMDAVQPVDLPQSAISPNTEDYLRNFADIAQTQQRTHSVHYNLPIHSNFHRHTATDGPTTAFFPNYQQTTDQFANLSQNIRETSLRNCQQRPKTVYEESTSAQVPLDIEGIDDIDNPVAMKTTEEMTALSESDEDLHPTDNYLKIDNTEAMNTSKKITALSESDDLHPTDNYLENHNLFNMNKNKFNYYEQNFPTNLKSTVMNDVKRKSLANTVMFIENIINRSTRNDKQDQNDINETHSSNSHATQQKKPQLKQSMLLELLQKSDKNFNTIPPNITVAESKNTESTNTNQSNKKNNVTTEKDRCFQKSETCTNQEDSENETVNEEPDNPVDIKIEVDLDAYERSYVEIEKLEDDLEQQLPKPSQVIEETDNVTFQRDLNGTPKEDLTNIPIISHKHSVNKAIMIIKNGSQSEAYFECPYCNLYFANPKRFIIHTKWHTFGLTHEKLIELVKEHEQQRLESKALRKRKLSKEDEQLFDCKDCDKRYCTLGSLQNHRQRNHSSKVRECNVCGIKVLGWSELRAHIKSHGAQFKCPHCPKKFIQQNNLDKHLQTHLEKKVPCPNCDKFFQSTALLRAHQRSHAKENSAIHTCTYCGKTFNAAYNLAVHERTHRNEKPFICEICNSGFVENSTLRRHVRVAHNSTTKPHVCEECKRCFKTPSALVGHRVRMHKDEHGNNILTCKEKRWLAGQKRREKRKKVKKDSSGSDSEWVVIKK